MAEPIVVSSCTRLFSSSEPSAFSATSSTRKAWLACFAIDWRKPTIVRNGTRKVCLLVSVVDWLAVVPAAMLRVEPVALTVMPAAIDTSHFVASIAAAPAPTRLNSSRMKARTPVTIVLPA